MVTKGAWGMICFHKWSKWSEVFSQAIAGDTSFKQQSKICADCGKVKLRYVWFSSYTAPSVINSAIIAIKGRD